jgi:hypothetical protein
METVTQRGTRLLAAFEDLATQEATEVTAGDFVAVVGLQSRMEPIVQFFIANPETIRDGEIGKRIDNVRSLRVLTSQAIGDQLARTRHELAEVKTSQRRLHRIAPAYAGSSERTHQRLAAVG